MNNGLPKTPPPDQIPTPISKGSLITLVVYQNISDKPISRTIGDELLMSFLLKMALSGATWTGDTGIYIHGFLHYHITVPYPVPAMSVKCAWNAVLENAGLLDSFYKEYGHYQPATTNVEYMP